MARGYWPDCPSAMAAAEAERAKTESEARSLPGVFPEWADIGRSPTPHPSRLLGQFLFVPGLQHFKPIFRLSDKLPQAGFNAGVLGEAPNRAQVGATKVADRLG
jgi:hypothetical protein